MFVKSLRSIVDYSLSLLAVCGVGLIGTTAHDSQKRDVRVIWPEYLGLAGSGHGEYGEIAVIAGELTHAKVVSFVKLICGTLSSVYLLRRCFCTSE